MITLAIDSTMNGCGVCVFDANEGVKAQKTREISRGQAEHLMPMIEGTLKEADKTYQDLNLIAVTHGPGAFTGMRIGIATAKALALALNIPAIGVCTLEAVATTASKKNDIPQNENLCVLLETKRKDFYIYQRKNQKWSEKQTASFDEVTEALDSERHWNIVGDAFDRFNAEAKRQGMNKKFEHLNITNMLMPSPQCIAEIGIENYEKMKKAGNERPKVTPVYLRPPDIGTPKTKMRKIAKK